VFHPHGYKGQAEQLVDAFSNGNYLGLPLLQWQEMAFDGHTAQQLGVQPYPHMVNWICPVNRYELSSTETASHA